MASLPRCDPNRLRCVLNPRAPPRRAGQNPITLVSVGSLPVVTLLIIAAVVMAGFGLFVWIAGGRRQTGV
jgi:hypothetical protein